MLEKRILEVLNESKLNKQDFAARLGISNSTLSHVQSGRNKASLDIVVRLLESFPDISPDWLLFGTGEMKRKEGLGLAFRESIQKDIEQAQSALKQAEKATNGVLNKLESLK